MDDQPGRCSISRRIHSTSGRSSWHAETFHLEQLEGRVDLPPSTKACVVSTARFLLGLVLASVALGPVVAAATAWRARLFPEWSRGPAILATTILTVTTVTLSAELLGTLGLLSIAPVTVTLTLVGSVGWYASYAYHRRRDRGSAPPARTAGSLDVAARPRGSSRAVLLCAIGATSVVVADWGSRTAASLHHGMTYPDSIWYHMPVAARFAQEGSITSLHFVDFGTRIPFYPANGELLHAVALLFMGTDILSPLLNMGWLAVVLLAAWCVGRPYGAAPMTLVAGAALMGTPGFVGSQAGEAYTDVVGLALMMSAVAVLVTSGYPSRWQGQRPAIALAAMAAGLALGTKFTFAASVIALSVGMWIVAPRGRRFGDGFTWLILVCLTGSFWYLRNLVRIGNPIPDALRIGPIRLPAPRALRLFRASPTTY